MNSIDPRPLRVALAQMKPEKTVEGAEKKGIEIVQLAARGGADIVLFPEMWQTGYRGPDEMGMSDEPWRAQALALDSSWIDAFRHAAAANSIAVVATYMGGAEEGTARNSALLIDRHGKDVLGYDKVHTCDFHWEGKLQPGSAFRVDALDTAVGAVNVGLMICYDREFPESCRSLMLQEAEIVLVPNACTMTYDRRGQLRARSYENMLATFLTNYAGAEHRGRSCAFDGITESPSGEDRDQQLVIAGEHEALLFVEVDLEELRQYRRSQIWGDTYRKPASYSLVSREFAPVDPFVRGDARR